MQQINLYHPIFRAQRRVFSAKTIGATLGVVAVSLLGIWLFGRHQVVRLEHELTQSDSRRAAEAERLARMQPSMTGALDPAAIEARARGLEAALERRRRTSERLRSGAAGAPVGFSPQIEALARARVDGLWLTRIVLAPGSVELAGSALAPSSVPQYLESLGAQSALDGTRFEHLALKRPLEEGSKPLEFELATELPAVQGART